MNKREILSLLGDKEYLRSEQMKVKSEAVWVAFLELDGLINKTKLAKHYFGKSASWLNQKINGITVNGKRSEFTAEEYDKLTAALRAVAEKLNEYADAVDAAELDEEYDSN